MDFLLSHFLIIREKYIILKFMIYGEGKQHNEDIKYKNYVSLIIDKKMIKENLCMFVDIYFI
jgi:hypothetical protein